MLTDVRIWEVFQETGHDQARFARAIEAEVLQAQEPVGWHYRTGNRHIASFCEPHPDVAPFDIVPLYAAPQPPAPCPYCDGTGDVHSIDGEWRGECNCGAEKYAQLQRENDELKAKVAEQSALIEQCEKALNYATSLLFCSE